MILLHIQAEAEPMPMLVAYEDILHVRQISKGVLVTLRTVLYEDTYDVVTTVEGKAVQAKRCRVKHKDYLAVDPFEKILKQIREHEC